MLPREHDSKEIDEASTPVRTPPAIIGRMLSNATDLYAPEFLPKSLAALRGQHAFRQKALFEFR